MSFIFSSNKHLIGSKEKLLKFLKKLVILAKKNDY